MTRSGPSSGIGPYVHLWISIVLSAAAQVFLKLGAPQVINDHWFHGGGLFRSGWMGLGIVAMIASLFSWLHSLRTVPLILAYNLAGFIHVLVPLSCWFFLGENVSALRWMGIALVFIGVVVIARPSAAADESL